jgi:Ca2+-transporting ATPase
MSETTIAHDAGAGLTSAAAAAALVRDGPNELARERPTSALRLLLRQFSGVMTWLLLAACAISVATRELRDAIAIAVILAVNAIVGFVQEARAERAVRALRALTAPHARVVRDATVVDIPARNVVVGDVLALEAGDVVAADALLLEASRLQINQAALTGESTPVEKRVVRDEAGTALADRRGTVYAGTPVVLGTARARVVATGMNTELGRIAQLLHETSVEVTPLQRRLQSVGATLMWLCAVVVVVVAGLQLARGGERIDVLMSAVSLAVAAVPEGLTAIVTIALALGVQRMAQRNVLVRKLSSVETLGSATVICTDKTGTLTTGEMTVRDVWGADAARTLFVAAACSDADLAGNTGDPMELAILRAALARGIARPEIESQRARVVVNPFDGDRKRVSVFRSDGVLYVKGAIESLAPLCTKSADGERFVQRATDATSEMAARGLRVLAVAVGASAEERSLTLVGLIGLADPPRTEAVEAVRLARGAGIKTVMITGDHPVTARAIAIEMGILGPGEDPAERVHARATPEQKIAIVRGWKARGDVVAMTGDGVNDAPALKEAHIGIAMGKSGTEVAREASAMVLADDNFASIVAAIREGRGIFANIKKTLVYLLSGNFGELLVMLFATLVGLPLPLTALQLLWINLVTDGLPALALVIDPPDAHALARPPRRPSEPMLGRREWLEIAFVGALTATLVVGVFAWALRAHGLVEARSLAFSVLVFSEVLRSAASRDPDKVFWQVGAFSNLTLLGVMIASLFIQLGIHHIPWTARVFDIAPIAVNEWLAVLALALVPVSVLEVRKLLRRRRHNNQSSTFSKPVALQR